MKNNLGFSLNIYIYGSQNFKKEIHEEISRSNIDYKLGDNGLIQDVNSLDTLKELVNDNVDDVFLIDDTKIIKENLINSKIKFLNPKDGIEHEFLKQRGIEDISVDSISDISKYILKKMKKLGLDDDNFDERSEIQDSITNIVNDAYSNDENDEDLDNIEDEDYELGDDLKELLASTKESKNENYENDEDLDNIEDDILTNNKEVKMNDLKKAEDFFSLDDLNESDIMAAFGNEESIQNLDIKDTKEHTIKLSNPDDIKDFLAKLLNSKALEITVKIKE